MLVTAINVQFLLNFRYFYMFCPMLTPEGKLANLLSTLSRYKWLEA